VERGINWIDTAAVYGLGHAEELVGKALRGLCEKPLVFTKCGLVWDENRAIGVIVYSPMLSGMLTGAMTRERALNLPADDWQRNA
jgi:aryl-alcohol dehydrogenase-like predicted oxidoreductase